MFSFRRNGTVIAEGLTIVGRVAADGLVEVNGQVEGELSCISLVVSSKARIKGRIEAEQVTVNGNVEGPIRGASVLLKSRAVVVGDIESQSLAIERGAYFEGRSMRVNGSNATQLAPSSTPPAEIAEIRQRAPLDSAAVVVTQTGLDPEDRAGLVSDGAFPKKKAS